MHFPSFLRLEYIKALWELFLFNMEKKKLISQVRDRDESKQIWNFRILSKKNKKKIQSLKYHFESEVSWHLCRRN